MVQQRRDNLVALRKDKDWLQKDVVDQLKNHHDIEISESYYGMIEQGVRTPKLNIALAISKLFDVNPNEIFF
ncbi:helix-turn-helix transcriptional regulator [Mesobacillus subterraneus]|uniref:helix-turn-helix transcriptional regulator n=1 Tax=Mesobacillus subterraneus TaxID=285983 RepID=UPI00273D2333|nr:helix-turn-helix transcriptional regulator [Mesobacillus subterraneus]WLR54871.1 helix-turn-helix transcriptional regulator [Mesobacillus subterraneus]